MNLTSGGELEPEVVRDVAREGIARVRRRVDDADAEEHQQRCNQQRRADGRDLRERRQRRAFARAPRVEERRKPERDDRDLVENAHAQHEGEAPPSLALDQVVPGGDQEQEHRVLTRRVRQQPLRRGARDQEHDAGPERERRANRFEAQDPVEEQRGAEQARVADEEIAQLHVERHDSHQQGWEQAIAVVWVDGRLERVEDRVDVE